MTRGQSGNGAGDNWLLALTDKAFAGKTKEQLHADVEVILKAQGVKGQVENVLASIGVAVLTLEGDAQEAAKKLAAHEDVQSIEPEGMKYAQRGGSTDKGRVR